MKYLISTLAGIFICTHWEKVWCPCYGCNDLDDNNQTESFLIFQDEESSWHLFEISMINVIEVIE